MKKRNGSTRLYPDTYTAWCSMKQRCYYAKRPDFHLYGGRGIKVCERWKSDFDAFLQDMGPRPSARHSLDRIDAEGHYAPENCRWATQSEQMSHTSHSVLVQYGDERMTLTALARTLGLNYSRLHASFRRKGLPLAEAIAEARRPGIVRARPGRGGSQPAQPCP